MRVYFLKDQLRWCFTWNQIFWGSQWAFRFMLHPERNNWVWTTEEARIFGFWECSSLLSTTLKISYQILRKPIFNKKKKIKFNLPFRLVSQCQHLAPEHARWLLWKGNRLCGEVLCSLFRYCRWHFLSTCSTARSTLPPRAVPGWHREWFSMGLDRRLAVQIDHLPRLYKKKSCNTEFIAKVNFFSLQI